jgi:large repetitive protein
LSSLDGAAFVACTDPVTYMNIPDGNHTLRARAKDGAGNYDTTPALHSWTIDSLAPAPPVIISPQSGEQVGFNPPTYSGTALPGSTVTLIVDGAIAGTVVADVNGNWSFKPAAAIALGAHTISANAKDAAGNTSPSTTPIPFTIDPNALDTRIVSGPLGPTSSKSATFDFESNLSGATFECSLDGAAFSACSDPSTFANLSEGAHTLQVRAKLNGNVDPTPAQRSWTVDTGVPVVPVVLLPANNSTIGTTTPEVRGTAEANTTLTVLIDGAVVGTTPVDAFGKWSLTLTTPLTAGAHTAAARTVDSAGNVSPTSAVNNFTVDLTTLDTFIVSGPGAFSRFNSAAFDIASNLSNVTYECSLDGAAFTACTDPVTFTGLVDGSHTILVRAKDAGGAVDPTPASFTWTVDTVVPTILVITPASGAVFIVNRVTVTGTAEPGATVRVNIDGQFVGSVVASSTGAWTLVLQTPLADGSHSVNATATDPAGNTSPVSNTNNFTIITSKLMVPTITEPKNGTLTSDTTPTLKGKAAPGSTVTIFIDGVSVGMVVADSMGDWTFTPAQSVGEGMHAITVSASKGPQQSDTSAPTTFTVDSVPPDTGFKTKPEVETTSATGEFEFSSTETDVTYECNLDGAEFAPCDPKKSFPDLAIGPHTVVVRATDKAGNVDPTPASYTWNRNDPNPPHERAYAGGGCNCSTVDPSALFALVGVLVALRRRRKS